MFWLRVVIGLLTLVAVLGWKVPTTLAQGQLMATQSYSRGTVIELVSQAQTTHDGVTTYVQIVKVRNNQTNQVEDLQIGSDQIPATAAQLVKVGDQVVLVSQPDQTGQPRTQFADVYRLPALIWLLIGFLVIVVIVSQMNGITSVIGMVLSLAVLLFFMVPQIVAGANPILISIAAAGIISAIIIYCGHGWHYRSHVALLCMLMTLAMVGFLAHGVVDWAHLQGIGDETASYLQVAGIGDINLQGLFLGGIILAALSVLDDSVISQVSVIYQLKQVKPDITFNELWRRGMEVGRDHISTLVNTLILAYAGASLPLFILFTLNHAQPIWLSLNDQMIAEEVVRTLTGSIGLVLSIPLTTLIAAYVVDRKLPKSE